MSGYSRDQVKQVLSSVMGKMQSEKPLPVNLIYDELAALAKSIDDLHADIAATKGHHVGGTYVPTATDELDAVIGSTEEASADIMDACEAIQGIAAEFGDKGAEIVSHTNKIFEACSFQDITGQRITKVVKTLKDIENTVDDLLNLFGPSGKTHQANDIEDNRAEDEKLMNGPQLVGQGVTQDDIDKLLAEFD